MRVTLAKDADDSGVSSGDLFLLVGSLRKEETRTKTIGPNS